MSFHNEVKKSLSNLDQSKINIIVDKVSWWTICKALVLAEVNINGFPNTAEKEDIAKYLKWLCESHNKAYTRFVNLLSLIV